MDFEFAEAVAHLPLTLAPLLLLLLAPGLGERGRGAVAGLLGASAVALLGLAVARAGTQNTLTVINPFMDPELGEPRVFELETITAPGWQWPAVASAMLFLPALVLLVRRARRPASPIPGVFCGALGAYYLLARLLLEKSAAPPALVWAVGTSFAMIAMMPFLGYYAATRALSVRQWVGQVLLAAVIHRGVLVGVALPLTLLGLGTHLDVHTIERVHLPIGGPVEFEGDRVTAWFRLMVVPQLTIWILFTAVAGFVLGAVPYFVRRRRQRSVEPTATRNP